MSKKWLAEYEIEAGFVLTEDANERWISGQDDVRVLLRKAPSTTDDEEMSTFLDIELIADSIENAARDAEVMHRNIVASLSLITQCRIRVLGIRKIVDWTPGIKERAVTIYRSSGSIKSPLPSLKIDHIESALRLDSYPKDDKINRAMQFFRRGISAKYSDEQFENFYFTVEVLSSRSLKKKHVVTCRKCKAELKCSRCDAAFVETEKPGSAVRFTLEQFLKNTESSKRKRLVNAILNARNSLQHGSLPDSIERKTGYTMDELTDVLGKIAFDYTLRSIRMPVDFPQLQLLVPSTYANGELRMKIQGFVGSTNSDPNKPIPSDYDGFRVSMIKGLKKI